jgi:copper oxidase (laccase) domain-containing protein
MASQLSHGGRLPSWNRPGLCRRSGADVRKLSRDQLPPIPLQTSTSGVADKEVFQTNSKALATIVQLEKNIIFLKQQHQETLEQLHKEIETLRNENRGV